MFIFNSNTRGSNGTGCLVIGILGVVAFFLILKGVFSLLYWFWTAPILIALTAIIRWQVLVDVSRNWMDNLKVNPLSALLQLALAGLLFPIFSLYLFLSALGGRKMDELKNQFNPQNPTAAPSEDEFVDFEELESRPKTTLRNDPLEPPIILHEEPTPPRKDEIKKPDNPYDQMFK